MDVWREQITTHGIGLVAELRFLWRTEKRPMSRAFLTARVTQPLWSHLL